jgi:hypothetical protein
MINGINIGGVVITGGTVEVAAPSDQIGHAPYKVIVNLANGNSTCDCPHFEHRVAPAAKLLNKQPNLNSEDFSCKHQKRLRHPYAMLKSVL